MKIRSGFVSNSSSSSFVLAVPADVYEKTVAKMHPYLQAVAKAMAEDGEGFGKKLKIFSELTVMDGGSNYEYLDVDFEGSKGEYEDIYEATEAVKELMEKAAGKDSFTHSIDG